MTNEACMCVCIMRIHQYNSKYGYCIEYEQIVSTVPAFPQTVTAFLKPSGVSFLNRQKLIWTLQTAQPSQRQHPKHPSQNCLLSRGWRRHIHHMQDHCCLTLVWRIGELNFDRRLFSKTSKVFPPFDLNNVWLVASMIVVCGQLSLGIQSPCQMMIGVYNHLRNARYLGSITILRRWLDP